MSIWQEPDPERDARVWAEPTEPIADAELHKLGAGRRSAMAKTPAMAAIWNSTLLDAARVGNAGMARVMLQGGGDPFWAPPSGPSAFESSWESADTLAAEEICRFGPYEQALDTGLLERAAKRAPLVAQEMVRWGAQPTPRALLNALEAGAEFLAEDMLAAGASAAEAAALARQDALSAGRAMEDAVERALARWEARTLGEPSGAGARPRTRKPGL